jgi:uncharacterized protein (DUF433 family)
MMEATMQLEDYFNFNTEPVEHIRLKGTRIDIDFVIELYKMHMSPEQIAVHFGCPLEPVQVYASITYYLQNKEAMDSYLARREKIGEVNYQTFLARQPSEALKRIRAIKAARVAKQTETP